ncbi:MAG TPA: hypothetical protein PK347_09940 [Burkholderiaceae bacterium]|mgnify:CR=1 FL=1|nr:hypothetical protein [Burkholderiaceae bacterium]
MKIANSSLLVSLIVLAFASHGQGLDSNANSKVNNAMAKRWSEDAKASGQAKSGYEKQNQDKILNVGKGKNCNLNVGTKQPGEKGDVIVTTKEVINVCK